MGGEAVIPRGIRQVSLLRAKNVDRKEQILNELLTWVTYVVY